MEAPTQTAGPSFAQRALITAGAVAVLWVGCRTTLPGIDADAWRGLAQRFGAAPIFSLFSIGVTPILSGAFAIEVARLLVPGIRTWEARSQDNATRIQRIWFALSILIGALQAYGATTAMVRIAGLVADPQSFVPIAVATLAGATALLFWLCLVVTRRGLVEGLWLLFVAQMIIGARHVEIDAATLRAAAAQGLALLAIVALLAAVGARVALRGEREPVSALVWPTIIGFYTATTMQAAILIVAGRSVLTSDGLRLAIFAGLAFLISLMRAPDSEPADSAKARIVLTALQIATVIAGSLAAASFDLPFAFDPIVVVVAAAVIQALVQSAMNRANP